MSGYQSREPDIEAEVRLLTKEEGGRHTPAKTGYRPAHLVIDDYLTTAAQHYLGQEWLHPGESCLAHLWFITPEVYPNSLWVGKEIQFQEGARVIGFAKVTKIFNNVLLKHS
ncbi:hypothetical protein [Gilvimarinus chinensis]|uniref:hypothetical protein n=1 Tax=Gilvimarinus chinensis TaxID=396005 RepID=UPI000363848E|nr:hypothetical protein [Gilvimarinus chinensis]